MSKKRQRWSKELIVERIRKRHDKGLPLSSGDVQDDDSPLYQAACNDLYFDSWEAALKAAGFDYDSIRKRQEWSRELIIERIHKRHQQGLSLSSGSVQREDGALSSVASCKRYFGSWKAAIEAAGFSYDDVRKIPAPYWSKELIIERIHERHQQGLSLSDRDVRREDNALFSSATCKRYFGSWKAAIEAAGFSYDDVRKIPAPYWSKELIIERIHERHQQGLSLSDNDVQYEDSSLYAVVCAGLYFESWAAAIESAGLSYENIRKTEKWSKAHILKCIKERHRQGLPLSAKEVLCDDSPLFSSACHRRHFGSWEAAVEAAGFSYPRVCKVRRTKDLSRSSKSEDRVTFLQNLGSRKKSRERNPREEKRG